MLIDALLVVVGFLGGYALRSHKDSSVVDGLLNRIVQLEQKVAAKLKKK